MDKALSEIVNSKNQVSFKINRDVTMTSSGKMKINNRTANKKSVVGRGKRKIKKKIYANGKLKLK